MAQSYCSSRHLNYSKTLICCQSIAKRNSRCLYAVPSKWCRTARSADHAHSVRRERSTGAAPQTCSARPYAEQNTDERSPHSANAPKKADMVSARIGSAPLIMNFRRLRSHAFRISGVDRLSVAPARSSAPANPFALWKNVDTHGRAQSAGAPAISHSSRGRHAEARRAAGCNSLPSEAG